MKSRTKVPMLVLCAVLLVIGSVVGTMAYLTDRSAVTTDLRTALHYFENEQITDRVSGITFGLSEDYTHITSDHDGTLVQTQQDAPVYAYYIPNRSNYDVYILSGSKIYLPDNSANLFAGMTQLTSFDGANLDTSHTEDMSFLFFECTKLPSLDVTGWDTSNVTTMVNMFGGNRLLTTITGLDTWNMSKVTDMANMFSDCSSLQKLDSIGTWQTDKVTAMECMFYNCFDLTDVDVSSWDVSNVCNMWGMFHGCKNMDTIDISRWNAGKVTNTAEMFDGCSSLTSITIPESVTVLGDYTFSGCTGLKNVTFLGSAPTIQASSFDSVNARACHSCTEATWTDAVKKNYGGTITWKGHLYEDGNCTICGEADPDYVKPVVTPTLTLKSPALEFKDMIKVVAFFTAENTQDVVEMGMITYTEKVDVIDINTAAHVIPGAEYEASSGRYYASSQGINAKYLADTVYLACYAKLSDGTYVYTKLAPYSPITYATNQLKNSTNTQLKQLVAAMLNYGAAAQVYFNYNVENLANASLTEEQLALPESYRDDMVSTVPAADASKQGSFANNKGFSQRKPAVSFEGAFSINYFFTPAYTPVDGITLYYWTEADFNAADVLTVDNATGALAMTAEADGQYRGDITGIAAKNISQAVYVAAVYSDGTTQWTSGVLGYSIGAYCGSLATKGGTIADLAMATAVYGYHAKAYFG